MKSFRLTAERVGGKCVITLLDGDATNTRPTIASQMADTPNEAIQMIAGYIEREIIRHEIERDIIEGRT